MLRESFELEMAMTRELVTVATFPTATIAEFARGELAEEGIDAYIEDANLVTTNWLWGNALGWVKVLVAAVDVERANGVLARRPELLQPTSPFATPDEIGDATTCLACGEAWPTEGDVCAKCGWTWSGPEAP